MGRRLAKVGSLLVHPKMRVRYQASPAADQVECSGEEPALDMGVPLRSVSPVSEAFGFGPA